MVGRRRLEILEYDEDWPLFFEREAGPLRNIFGKAIVEMFHVGSTSVPGLLAKPTIDILIEVERGTDIPLHNPRMESLGYICRGECLDAPMPGTPGRFYFVRKAGVVHLVHVHVCTTGHPDIHEKLYFRGYLRTHPDVALEYGTLKQRLAKEFEYDNLEYMRGKDAFIKDVVADSVAWHRLGAGT